MLCALSRVAGAQTVAIEGATLVVAPGKTIEGATIVITGERITAVGKQVAIPAAARRIPAAGKVVTAGLVDVFSRLGMVEVEHEAETNEGRFAPGRRDDAIHAAYRVVDGYNPRSVAIPVSRAGGVTAVVAVPSGGLVGGTSAWMSLADGNTTAAIVRAPLAMHATLGAPARANAEGSRGRALERLRELFTDADAFRRNRRQFERNQTRAFAAERLDLEALAPVLDGRLPLLVSVNRSSDILAALSLRKEWPRLRLVVVGGVEAWTVAKELAAARVPVILDPFANLPDDFDRVYVREDTAKLLVDAGVKVAISTLGEWANVRTLRQRAGVASAYGLSRDQALTAVTSVPAEIFGIADRGTLERGKVADLVVWSGDPLEISSRAEYVFIGGVEQSLRSHQSRLFERYRDVEPKKGNREKPEGKSHEGTPVPVPMPAPAP
jgi:imidazolonepropionase-like amidohydrolase